MRAEQSWSLLDPKPVLFYIKECDEYLVYWNGIAMPHKMALAMAMEHACGIYPTPEMKTALEKNYERLYYTNAFETRAWDDRVASSPIYPYLKRIMNEHLLGVIERHEPSTVLGWFNYNKARNTQ